MRRRTALVALGLLPLLIPVSASAAGPSCRLLPDARGDAALASPVPGGAPLAPGGPSDDLLSADIASDGRAVSAVFRMAQVLINDPVAPTGHRYTLYFAVAGSSTLYFVTATTAPTGPVFSYGYIAFELGRHAAAHTLGAARGKVDPARGEVRVDAPGAAFGGRGGLRKGLVLRELRATTARWWGHALVADPQVAGLQPQLAGQSMQFDDATGYRYVVGTPSCVRPRF